MGEDALDTIFPEAEAPQEVIEAPEVEPAPQEVAQEPEPVVEAPEAPQEREERTVPLPTFLDMRDKQKEADRRAEALERELAELKASRQEPKQAPDPYDDPQGYAAFNNQQVQEAVTAQKFETSDLIARQSHGDEAVEAATQWASEKAAKNPAFAAEYMRERHPIDWIVRQHKRDSLMSQVGDDPDEFVRRRAAELGLIAQTAPVAQPAAKPAAPPRSIASDATPTTPAMVDPVAEFNAIFDRK